MDDRDVTQGQVAIGRGWLDRGRALQVLDLARREGLSFARAAQRAGLLDAEQTSELERATWADRREAGPPQPPAPPPADPRRAAPGGPRRPVPDTWPDDAPPPGAPTPPGAATPLGAGTPPGAVTPPGAATPATPARPGASRVPGPGARVGDYVVERLLGQGGMGAVVVGQHVTLGARHAVKVQLLGAGQDAAARRERFAREVRALAKVDRHPGIVRIHSFGVDDAGTAFCALDLVEGGDLSQAIARGPLPPSRVARLGEAIARALDHVHRSGIVHRDLKPANVLLRAEDDAPVLTDFGLARDEAEERMTKTGQVVGTIHYMAPEQVAGDRDRIGPCTDVFALGAVLYEALTGQPPFQGDSPVALARAIVCEDPPPPSAQAPAAAQAPAGTTAATSAGEGAQASLLRDLDVVVLRCLDKEPGRRPAADVVADALARVGRGEPLAWQRSGVLERLGRRLARRDPRAVALAAVLGGVAVVAAAAGAAELLWLGPRRRADALRVEETAWLARVLLPWDLGVLPGARAPCTSEELARHAAALEASRVGPDLALDAALAHVAAARRALAIEDGAPGDVVAVSAGRAAPDLVVDARVLAGRGRTAEALRRLDLALADDAGCRPARLLRLVLLAGHDPGAFLTRARAAQDEAERALVARLAPAVLAARYAADVERAPARPRAEGRAGLEALAQTCRDLGLDPGATLGPAKARALEASTPAWTAALEAALGRRGELDVLGAVADVAEAAPRADVGPGLRALALGALEHVLDAYDAAVARGTDARTPFEIAARALAVESLLLYRLGVRCPHGVRMARLAFSMSNLEPALTPEVMLACLRYETTDGADNVIRRVAPRAVDEARGRFPSSRALRASAIFRRFDDRFPPPAEVPGLLGEIEATLEFGLDDLSPRFTAHLWLLRGQCLRLLVAQDEERAGRGRDDPARRRERGRAILESARRAQELLARQSLNHGRDWGFLRALEDETYGLELLGDLSAAADVWCRAVGTARERVARLDGGRIGDVEYERAVWAGTYHLAVQTLSRAGREDESLALARELLANSVLVAARPSIAHFMVARLARAQRRAGQVEEAWAALSPLLPAGLENADFRAEVALLTAARGDPDAALRLLDDGLRQRQRDEVLTRARDELMGGRERRGE